MSSFKETLAALDEIEDANFEHYMHKTCVQLIVVMHSQLKTISADLRVPIEELTTKMMVDWFKPGGRGWRKENE